MRRRVRRSPSREGRRDQQDRGALEHGDADLRTGDGLPVVRRGGRGRQRVAGLTECRCEHQLAGEDLGYEVGLQVVGPGPYEGQQTRRRSSPTRAGWRRGGRPRGAAPRSRSGRGLRRRASRGQPGRAARTPQGPPGTVPTVEHVADDGAHLIKYRVHADLSFGVRCPIRNYNVFYYWERPTEEYS